MRLTLEAGLHLPQTGKQAWGQQSSLGRGRYGIVSARGVTGCTAVSLLCVQGKVDLTGIQTCPEAREDPKPSSCFSRCHCAV